MIALNINNKNSYIGGVAMETNSSTPKKKFEITKEMEKDILNILNEQFYKYGLIDYELYSKARARIEKS
jgi:hypothetical protein